MIVEIEKQFQITTLRQRTTIVIETPAETRQHRLQGEPRREDQRQLTFLHRMKDRVDLEVDKEIEIDLPKTNEREEDGHEEYFA